MESIFIRTEIEDDGSKSHKMYETVQWLIETAEVSDSIYDLERALEMAEKIESEVRRRAAFLDIAYAMLQFNQFDRSVQIVERHIEDSYLAALMLAEIAKKTERRKYLERAVSKASELQHDWLWKYTLKIIIDYNTK